MQGLSPIQVRLRDIVSHDNLMRRLMFIMVALLGISQLVNLLYFENISGRTDTAQSIISRQSTTINQLQAALEQQERFNQLLGALIVESPSNPAQPLTPAQRQTLQQLKQFLSPTTTAPAHTRSVVTPASTTTLARSPPTTLGPTSTTTTTQPTTTTSISTTTTTAIVCIEVLGKRVAC